MLLRIVYTDSGKKQEVQLWSTLHVPTHTLFRRAAYAGGSLFFICFLNFFQSHLLSVKWNIYYTLFLIGCRPSSCCTVHVR